MKNQRDRTITAINRGKNGSQLIVIDATTLKEYLEERSIILVDVREAAEYSIERITGAKRVSLSAFDSQKIKAEGKKFVLYCQSGKRSTQAAQKLFADGFDEVIHLEGGLNAWKQAGYPVEKSKNPPMSIMRQVQIVAGSLVIVGTVLGTLISPWFLILSGFVGSGLVFAGITNTCALGMLLAQMPWSKN